MRRKLLSCFLLTVSSSWADVSQIRHVLEPVLGQSNGTAAVKSQDFFSQINTSSIGALSPDDLNSLLPLARKCLQSSRIEIRQDGLQFFIDASLRSDSADLLEPYFKDLESIINEPGNPLREGALVTLVSTLPKVPPEAISYLSAHLEDKINSAEQDKIIASSLLAASSNDPTMIERVLKFVDTRSDKTLRIGVLQQLGLLQTTNNEALTFIGAGLNSNDSDIRRASIDATGRLHTENKARFSSQLTRIATDPDETQQNREQADHILKQ